MSSNFGSLNKLLLRILIIIIIIVIIINISIAPYLEALRCFTIKVNTK